MKFGCPKRVPGYAQVLPKIGLSPRAGPSWGAIQLGTVLKDAQCSGTQSSPFETRSGTMPITSAVHQGAVARSHIESGPQSRLNGSDEQALADAVSLAASTEDAQSTLRLFIGSQKPMDPRDFVRQMLAEDPSAEEIYLDRLTGGTQQQAAEKVIEHLNWSGKYLAAHVPGVPSDSGGMGNRREVASHPMASRSLNLPPAPEINTDKKPVLSRPLSPNASQADHVLHRFEKIYGDDGSLEHVGDTIGGKVKVNIDAGIFDNGCALRASYALQVSGINMPQSNIPGKTVSGSDGKQYFPRLTDLVPYLQSSKSGLPKAIEVKDQAALQALDRKGIVYMKEDDFATATGHIAFWDGKDFLDESAAYVAGADKILFFPLDDKPRSGKGSPPG
jgi:hypothetical protein